MFNVGGGEVLVILVLVLVVLGPDKLPSAARTFGKHLGDFRRISGGFREEIANAMNLDSSAPTHAAAQPAAAQPAAAAVADAAPAHPAPAAPIVTPIDDDELAAVRSEGPVESFV